MSKTFSIRLTPSILLEMEEAIEDAVKAKCADKSNALYQKIRAALESGKGTKRGLVLDVDDQCLDELRDRTLWNVGPDGVCKENLGWSTDAVDKGYWLGRMRAYNALLVQLNKLGK